MRRIAFFTTGFEGGGFERSTLALAGGLAERGQQVDLVVCSVDGPMRGWLREGVNVVPLRASSAWRARLGPLAADPGGAAAMLRPVLLSPKPSRFLRFGADLRRYLAEVSPEVLVSGMPYLNLLALWARRRIRAHTRIVVTERNTLSAKIAAAGDWAHGNLAPMVRRTYREADAIVGISDGVSHDLAGLTGLPEGRITTIYNPVIVPGLEEKAREPLEHPWFAEGQPPVVLAVGRLQPSKDYPTLLRAFARLRDERDVRLVILGEAPKPRVEKRIRKLVERLGIGSAVELPGFVENPYAWMARAAVFVLSSAWEGFGNVLVEAMACGCTVVSTDCPSGPAEVLDGGRFGALVDVGDDAALAGEIGKALDSPSDPVLLRQRASLYSLERTVAAYQELFVKLGGTAPSSARSPCARASP